MAFQFILGIVAIVAGGVASISGFGIGSLITPLLALEVGTSIAVAGVSIAHFWGTMFRFLTWRKYINKKILLSFGLTSAVGGLIGAILHNSFYNVVLTIIFGCLLVFSGLIGLTGFSEKFRFSGIIAWIAGGLSGLFGGLVGNQGGIRSASMLGFNLGQKEFVATATGIALMVDVVRVPVYLAAQGKEIMSIWQLVLVATIGVFIGTEIGIWFLKKIPKKTFNKVVSAIILVVGILVMVKI